MIRRISLAPFDEWLNAIKIQRGKGTRFGDGLLSGHCISFELGFRL